MVRGCHTCMALWLELWLGATQTKWTWLDHSVRLKTFFCTLFIPLRVDLSVKYCTLSQPKIDWYCVSSSVCRAPPSSQHQTPPMTGLVHPTGCQTSGQSRTTSPPRRRPWRRGCAGWGSRRRSGTTSSGPTRTWPSVRWGGGAAGRYLQHLSVCLYSCYCLSVCLYSMLLFVCIQCYFLYVCTPCYCLSVIHVIVCLSVFNVIVSSVPGGIMDAHSLPAPQLLNNFFFFKLSESVLMENGEIQ